MTLDDDPRTQRPDRPRPLRPWARVVLSVLLLWHVSAVFVGPWSLPPASELATDIGQVFRPYLEAAYLNNGYQFFAPDPGTESHLVRYVLTMPDGTTRDGVFPSLQEHRPRLLYHRHFMLSETINRLNPPDRQPGMSAADVVEYHASEEYLQPRRALAAYCRSFADHLIAAHGAKSVSLYLRRHLFPAPWLVEQGKKLDDPESYRDEFLGNYEAEPE